MQHYTYTLTTLSSLIISPRSNAAFYRDLGDFCSEKIKGETGFLEKDRFKVIYPFYRYGEYDTYAPEEALYYIPGSSVKGALCQDKNLSRKVMVDDVPVCNNSIVLRNLYKAQYLQEDQSTFAVFFENVAVEMIKAKTEHTGELYSEDENSLIKLFESANKLTIKKIKQQLFYLEALSACLEEDEKNTFSCAIEKLANLENSKNVILLGGYKGLLHSINFSFKNLQDQEILLKEIKSAIYLDKETMLPHGLVKVELLSV